MPLWKSCADRKSTRLNSSLTVIYTLSLHDALPISQAEQRRWFTTTHWSVVMAAKQGDSSAADAALEKLCRSEEHTSELQSHSDLHSFPTRRSSDLASGAATLVHDHSLERGDGSQTRRLIRSGCRSGKVV